jgi:hypothetical protein
MSLITIPSRPHILNNNNNNKKLCSYYFIVCRLSCSAYIIKRRGPKGAQLSNWSETVLLEAVQCALIMIYNAIMLQICRALASDPTIIF